MWWFFFYQVIPFLEDNIYEIHPECESSFLKDSNKVDGRSSSDNFSFTDENVLFNTADYHTTCKNTKKVGILFCFCNSFILILQE